jgi:hypothetical protein
MRRPYLDYYPGMLTAEAQIWNSFRAANPEKIVSPDYNVRVGSGRDPGPTVPDYARQAAILNSQLRLDVVSPENGVWWIYEVKVGARAGCVGQLQLYQIYHEDAFPDRLPIQLAVVTDLPTQGLDRLCARVGIKLFLQPVVFS